MEAAGATIEALAPLVAGAQGRHVFDDGDMEAGIWSAGLVIGLVHDIPSCEEIVQRVMRAARETIDRLSQLSRGGTPTG